MLRTALALATRGLHVFPCRVAGKEPACEHGCKDATTDPEIIRKWWHREPQCNVAIATGSVSNVFAIDLDNVDAECELRRLETEHGGLPATVEVITARGRHVYFQMPETPVRNSAGKIAPGIDVRGNGGYVLAPPSIHPSGKQYEWSVDCASAFAAAPDWLLAKITDANGNGATPTPLSEWRALIASGVAEGSPRRPCRRRTLSGSSIPLPARNYSGGSMADGDNIIRLAELQDSGKDINTTEDGMALVFAERHAGHLRYVAVWSRWLSYDGTCWRYDDTLHVFERARVICREVAAACVRPAGAIMSAKTVAAVEKLARSDRRLAARAAQWDASPGLFNAADATVDLYTGDGRAPDPFDYMTKRAACAVAARGTAHPMWTAFLNRVTDGNVELQQFLQRYIGYCCTGSTTEHAFVFAYGTGANGKGTFLNTVAGVFGDYATVADMSTFLASNQERHPTELAKLAGARLVVAQETQKGRRWDETKIKALTGGDKITARFMRQDFFDFTPMFKLFIAGNHKPRLSSVDEAMRRRLLLVPFTVQIPVAERDPDLPRKLQAEWPAILRWAVDGCLEWQQTGLAPPQIVRDATDSYFADQDHLQQWLDDCTQDAGLFAFTRIRDLFSSWKKWCDDRNLKPGSASALSEALADRGFIKKREAGTGQRGFAHLTTKTS